MDDAGEIGFRYLLFFIVMVPVSFLSLFCLFGPVVKPDHAEGEHHDGGYDAQDRSGKCIRAKVGHGYGVLYLGRARKSCHGKGKCPKGNGAWNQPFGDVGRPEKRDGYGKNHEGYHKEGNASVCKDCAAQDNCQYSSFLAKPAGDKMGDGIRIPAYLH